MGPQLRTVLSKLQQLAGRDPAGPLTDAELLRRYQERRDEAAFESLVWRHGGMVLGVCRRLLPGEQDAEDAFQATFLALARSAGAISRRESVGGWLYRVAGRVARRARARTVRHAARDLPDEVAAPASDPAGEAAWRDLRPLLDEEVGRLPAKYRVPFVLCYLEGRTNEETARELGWSRGTVATRLAGARQRLRARLTRRGVAPSAGAVAVALGREATATAAAPAPLVLTTARAALAYGRGEAAGVLVSEPVLTLTRGVLRTMYFTRLSIMAAVLVAAGLAVIAATAAAHHFLADPPGAATAQAPTRGPARQTAGPAGARPKGGQLLFYRQGHLTLLGPDGKGEKKVSKDRGKFMPGHARLSPDGKRVAFLVQAEEDPPRGRDPRQKLYVRDLGGPEPGTDLGVEAQTVSWSPDGKQLAITDFHGDDPKTTKCASWLVDVKTKEKTALKVPDNQMVTDWSRDGRYFLTTEPDARGEEPAARLHLVRRDGSEDRVLKAAGRFAVFGRLSPDGRRVLYMALDPQRQGNKPGENQLGLFVLDIRLGKAVRVEEQPLNGLLMGHCWSPDGKRIAFAWRQKNTPPGQQTESHLVVADPDGRNAVTLATERSEFGGVITLGDPDWR
jgi:RNA polymerase sigma factor (sigma-70 family)